MLLRDYLDILRLRTFSSLNYAEFDSVVFFEGSVPLTDNGAVVNKYIFFTGISGNKTVAFSTIKPLYLANFSFCHDFQILRDS